MIRYISLLLFIGLALGQSDVDPIEATRRAKAAAEKAQAKGRQLSPIELREIRNRPAAEAELDALAKAAAEKAKRKLAQELGLDYEKAIVLKTAVIYLLNGERIDGDIVEIVAADKYIVVRTESLERRRISYAYIDYIRHNNKGLADYLQAAANKPEPKPVDVPKSSHRIPKEKNTNKHNYYFKLIEASIIPTEFRYSDFYETRLYWLQYKYAVNHTLDYSLKKGLFGATDESIDDWVYSHNFGIRKNISERISINLWYNLVYDIEMSEYKGHDEGWVSDTENVNLPRYFELILQYESKRFLSFGLRLKLGARFLNTGYSGGSSDLINLALHQNEVNNMLNRFFLSFSCTGLAFSF